MPFVPCKEDVLLIPLVELYFTLTYSTSLPCTIQNIFFHLCFCIFLTTRLFKGQLRIYIVNFGRVPHPFRSNFLHFYAVFGILWPNNRFVVPLWSWHPLWDILDPSLKAFLIFIAIKTDVVKILNYGVDIQ